MITINKYNVISKRKVSDTNLECVANVCEVGVICACDNDWKNHGQYVKCVKKVTNIAKKAGIISGKEKGEIVSEAAKSDCGKK